jgi:radical SAM protein with 4Fe4S-binding SPASM domain
MEFALFQKIIQSLEAPSFLCLNYSGESLFYPRLAEAIHLAASTGAATEVVTTLIGASESLLEQIAGSPLDRLVVSLHTMDPVQYHKIYGAGSIDHLKDQVERLQALRQRKGSPLPQLDFCFVAMEENLDQLVPVAHYARQCGAQALYIHPIIGRYLNSPQFPRELVNDRLAPEFRIHLRHALLEAQSMCKEMSFTVLNFTLQDPEEISETPIPFGIDLPEGACIYTCDQDPRETVHIMANGDVVICEVHDDSPLGNLNDRSLSEIWRSPAYQKFRQDYWLGKAEHCRECPWKWAFRPGPWKHKLKASDGMHPQFMRGWHWARKGETLWSKKESYVALANCHRQSTLRLS